MHFSFPLSTSLILLPLLQQISFAAPAPAPAPIPNNGADSKVSIIPAHHSGGAALETKDGTTRVYYQSKDGAIHELFGSKRPDAGNAYTDTIVVPAGQALKGTPLAVTDLTLTFFIRLYYVSPDNQLKEILNNSDNPGWSDGALNYYDIFVRPKSKYLYAISTPGGLDLRVGYQSPDGYLSEAAYDPVTSEWNTYTF